MKLLTFRIQHIRLARIGGLLVGLVLAARVGSAQDALVAPTPHPAPAATREEGHPFARIVLIGASATAGFTESEPLGGPQTPHYALDRYLDAALLAPHERVQNFASTLLFLRPQAEAERQIHDALQTKPSLVVGVDFLFWFCYGAGMDNGERLLRFEDGLKLLESFSCPVVVGDIPDASGAATSMLSPDQIPPVTVLNAANRRLREWAARRRDVMVVPLADFMRAAMANDQVVIHGHTLPQGKTRALLQPDRLHPTPMGCAVLSLRILDTVVSAEPETPATDVRWDSPEVFRRGLDSVITPTNNPAK